MPIGNKLAKPLHVPKWVVKNKEFQRSFLRGLFDTDGCVYADRHIVKGINYIYPNVAITSHSKTLLKDVDSIFKNLGFKSTSRNTQKSVYLRGSIQIEKFFKEVGTHNSKHQKRFVKIMEEYRSGHNGAVSKTAAARKGSRGFESLLFRQ